MASIVMEEKMAGRDRIVAVSLLTERELAVVGQTLQRVYHLGEDRTFDDLIDAIDEADKRMHVRGPSSKGDPAKQ